MASYNFYDNKERPLRNRFLSVAEEGGQDETLIRSRTLWRETFSNEDSVPSESAMANLLDQLKGLTLMAPRVSCPRYRVFVSHRQVDKDYALRIANIAHNNGVEFWLDVLDPTLASLPALTHLSPAQIALLTACVIEMGLINSTHVLAVMTQDTKGGEWVPYEYGRVRRINNTVCWQHPLHSFVLPDYMLLGKVTVSELDIDNWLSSFPPLRCRWISWAWSPTIPLP